MRKAAISLLAIVATACSGSTAAHSSPSPSPSLSPSPSASATPPVATLVGPFALTTAGGTSGHVSGGYYLNLLGPDGHPPPGNITGYAQTFRTPIAPNSSGDAATYLPFVSVSRSRIYYLEGDSIVKYVGVDSRGGIAGTVPGGKMSAAVFAVSPDDQRIAVAILDYSMTPVRLRIYVEDLQGGGNHVEILSSTTVAEWPVGWHAGNLVIAVGSAYSPTDAPNPYQATGGYQLVDPVTGNRIALMGSTTCQVVGPLTSAGTACVDAVGLHMVDWTGAMTEFGGAGMTSGALSPDGATIAACCQAGGGESIVLLKGHGSIQATRAVGRFVAWMDQHTLIAGGTRSGPFMIVDLNSGSVASQVPGNDFEGVFPADLG